MAQPNLTYNAPFSFKQVYSCGGENGPSEGPGKTGFQQQHQGDYQSLGTKSLMDWEISPTSSMTAENSSSVNVLKLAQTWQQNQQQEQQGPETPASASHKRKRSMESMNGKWERNIVEENKENGPRRGLPLILEPKDLHSHGKNRIFTEEKVHELFVSACFYGRLGFVQPPCCLLCTYRETTEGIEPNLNCQKHIVWRKNAETPLHPNQLDGNILIFPCHVARKLLKGERIEGRAWDKDNKKIISM